MAFHSSCNDQYTSVRFCFCFPPQSLLNLLQVSLRLLASLFASNDLFAAQVSGLWYSMAMKWRNGAETTTEQSTKRPVKASRRAMIGERNTAKPLSGNDLPEAVTAPRESAKKPNDANGNGPAHTESVTARQRQRSGERRKLANRRTAKATATASDAITPNC